ncbi:hypothetical protein [Mycobacterium sp. NPDC050041]|uniref:hypothetical protein n=1 Tax=Mycobacterium sp. NPDC050041 TaxID=3364293 RepID=UPI003C2E0B62
MTVAEWLQIGGVVSAILIAVLAYIQNRRKPKLDEEQTKAIKNEVAKTSHDLNLARDLRTLDLEVWGDAMRPWASAMTRRDEMMMHLLADAYERLEMPMPPVEPLPPMPKFPTPRPIPRPD